ncbi:GtrA family protein [Tundrisphaera sp. TA3]|uniref:GtrA family protein n=1 Tax=Tundrisphaera sp. TA3 TaxID=3435775 RepID=UPI003EB70C37
MTRVTLIVVCEPGASCASDRLPECRDALQDLGYSVEILASAAVLDGLREQDPNLQARPIPGDFNDLAGSAIAGLREASGDLRILLDAGMTYTSDDLVAVVRRLAVGDVQIAVASRNLAGSGSIVGRLFGAFVRPLLGSTDPFSGLIGLKSLGARRAESAFRPVGSRFALEILARVEGPRADVAVGGRIASTSRWSFDLGEIRQAKRLSDDRFGNVSRLLQFCVVGASGMVVDLTFYALFQMIFAATPMAGRVAPLVGGPLAPAAAGVVAVALALTWNFALNRRLTFNDAKRGSIVREYGRYVVSNLAGIILSLTLRLTLPNLFGFFRSHRLAAAVVGIVAATGVSFTLTRWFVFGRRAAPALSDAPMAGRVGLAGLSPAESTGHELARSH